MSYILEALKKSDQDRAAAQARDSSATATATVHYGSGSKTAYLWLLLGSIVAIGSIMLLKVLEYQTFEPTPAPIHTAAQIPESKPQHHSAAPADQTNTVATQESIQKESAAEQLALPIQPQPVESEPVAIDITETETAPDETDLAIRTETSPPAERSDMALAAAPPAPMLRELDISLRQSIEPLKLEGHFYDPQNRRSMAIIDGKVFHAGDWIRDELQITAITQHGAVFKYQTQLFQVPNK